MKTKKKTVTAKELLSLMNSIKPNDFFVLVDRSFNINGIEGTFSSKDGERIIVNFKGYKPRDYWYLNDQDDYKYFLYMLSLVEYNDDWFYGPEQQAEERLKKYFKKVRKTRSDKGKKRGKYNKKVEGPSLDTPFIQVNPAPHVPPSRSVFELLEKILNVLQEINSKM